MRAPAHLLRWLGLSAYLGFAVLVILFLTPIGGWKALDVLTGSMRPAIRPGALVLIHRVPLNSIHPGNVVTYVNPHDTSELITHRVTGISKTGPVTMITVKGDANTVADPPFPGGQIKGRVATIIPAAGRILNIIHNPFGLALLVILPALLVIWTEIRTLRRVLSEEALAARRAARSAAMRRHLDSMSRLAVLPAAVIVLALFAVGATLAALESTVSLTGNSFSAGVTTSPTPSPSGSPTPTPSGSPNPTASPCPTNATISNTGPGSTNIIRCTSTTTITNSNSTTVNITNNNHQSTSRGGSNTNTTTTNVNVTY